MAKRKIEIEGDTAFIPLSKGAVALIDAVDVPLVEAWSWHLSKGGRERALSYPARKVRENGSSKTQRLHQLLMPERDGLVVDHIDRNPLNNRRSNLRYASRRTNVRNSNRSAQHGLRYSKQRGTWTATLHIGEFETVEEARAAYDAAQTRLFPECRKGPPSEESGPHSGARELDAEGYL